MDKEPRKVTGATLAEEHLEALEQLLERVDLMVDRYRSLFFSGEPLAGALVYLHDLEQLLRGQAALVHSIAVVHAAHFNYNRAAMKHGQRVDPLSQLRFEVLPGGKPALIDGDNDLDQLPW